MRRSVTTITVLVLSLLTALLAAPLATLAAPQAGGAPLVRAQAATQPISVNPGSLTDHSCNAAQWQFVITQIDTEADAPATIHVTWANGASEDVALSSFTGGTAHYLTTSNLDSTVTGATAEIYAGWSGTFNLSDGPCGAPTATVPVTQTVPVTSTVPVTQTVPATSTVPVTQTVPATATTTATTTPHVTTTATTTPATSVTPSVSTTATTTGTSTLKPTGTTTPKATVASLPTTGSGPTGGSGSALWLLIGAASLLLLGAVTLRRRSSR